MIGADSSPPPVPLGTALRSPSLNDPRVIAYYFEREFTLTPSQIDNVVRLELEHLFDDGGVVYVNGAEVLRHDMPSGVVTSETLSTGGGDPVPSGRVGVPTTSLVVGSNRIAVEVHQNSAGSSDVMFGLRATLVEQPPGASDPQDTLVFNECSAYNAPGGVRVELANISAADVDLAGYRIGFSEGGAHTFDGGALDAGGFLVLDGSVFMFTPRDNDRLFLYDPAGHLIDARRVTGRLRGRSDAFDGRWLFPSAETFGSANTFAFEDDVVINEIMYHPRAKPATPDTAAVFGPVTLLDWGATWRFNEAGQDLGLTWQNGSHPVGGDWRQGPGPLGWDGPSVKNPPVATALTQPLLNPAAPVIAYYFETELVLTQAQINAIAQLQIVHLVDDGAVFYINGQEVSRFGMPNGQVTSTALATVNREAVPQGPFDIPKTALVPGSNRISVSVHQNTPGSSDVVFGMRLVAVQEVSPFIPGEPFRASNETWGELHNRSADRAIDLGGWRFSDGIDFTFPAGTTLAPGGYLVVAADAAELSAKHPGVAVLGDFGGRLSRGGERLRLVDQAGNPADEVTYADGGASSLELRDPHADNSAGDAWSASGESHRGNWNTYQRTGRATNGRNDPSGFQEFVFGLFYIKAMDSLGASSFFPREGVDSRAMIPWNDGQARLQNGAVFPTNLRILMPVADANFMHTNTEVMSNDRLPCTVIHNEHTIYYGCGVRLKSSQRGRLDENRVGFNIRFPADNLFLGCHATIACDRSGQSEIMVQHMAAQVGGVPAMFDDVGRVIQPRANSAGSTIIMKSRFDEEWLDNQFPNGSDGSTFEFELIYYPLTTTGGPEGLKLPQPDGVNGVQMRNQGGSDKELYRWHWLLKNNRDADDYSGMIKVLDAMGLTGTAYNNAVHEVIDVDQWLRTFAFLNLTGIGDNYGTHPDGAWHNAHFHIRATDGKATFFPWDMDFTFSNDASSGVTPSQDLNKMIAVSPANERAYYGHLLDMIETTFNTAYMNPWLSHYSLFLDSGLTGHSGYIGSRGTTVRGLINSAVANVAYRITTASGGSTAGSTTTVRGDGWVNVRSLRLSGTGTALAVRWTDDNSWEVTLPVAPGTNNYTIEAIGFDGAVVGSAAFAITGTGTVLPADATTLAVSEVHYHPARAGRGRNRRRLQRRLPVRVDRAGQPQRDGHARPRGRRVRHRHRPGDPAGDDDAAGRTSGHSRRRRGVHPPLWRVGSRQAVRLVVHHR